MSQSALARVIVVNRVVRNLVYPTSSQTRLPSSSFLLRNKGEHPGIALFDCDGAAFVSAAATGS